MTRLISTNAARFADNGDIGQCDTSVNMSEDNLPGEAAAVRGEAFLTHIEDYSVKSANSNILDPRLIEPCNDPMTPECHDSAISVSGFVANANSPAEATQQPTKSTPNTSPTTSNLNSMISAEFGAGLDDDREEGDELGEGDDDDALGGQQVTIGTLDYSVISSSNPGPKPSQEALALAATFTGKLGHQNAISDECSSNDGVSQFRQSDGAGAPRTPLSSSSLWEPGSVCETKTVNKFNYIDIPNNSTDINPSFNSVCPQELSTYKAMSSLSPAAGKVSSSMSTRRGGWKIPAGAGLRGGAPLPGETSAISNGTSGWGPPPSAGGGSGSGSNGWGSAPPAAANSAWGSPQQNINISNGDEPGQNNSKMLNTMPPSSGSAGQANQGLVTTQPAAPMQPAGPAAAGSTSWAAAAGKGLPPSEGANQGSNGTTNKQLEQLNSVREALFSQDGWGCQNVKQDTSWDVGASGGAGAQPPASEPPSAAAPAPQGASQQPPKADSMQWTPPGGAPKNDGTDLWRSTLSGVPQPPKPQPSTPWGNHTPANPADYKEWGREEGGMSDAAGMPGNGPSDNDTMWTPGSGPGSSGSGGGSQAWPDQERRDDRPGQFNDRDAGPNWGGPSKPKDEGMGGWNGAGSNHWGGGGNNAGNGGAGWGPPPSKGPGAGGGWGAGPAGPPGGRPGQWPENDSPTMGRRFDDGGTGIWGGKAPAGPMQAGPPGGWKDMPVTNPNGARGPPGQSRLPPGPGPVKPSDNSPWGQPHPNRGWGEDGANGGAWGVEDKPRAGGDMWPGKKNWDERGVAGMPSMRSSPSWDDPNNMMGDRNWRPNSDTDIIWKSRQFKILSEMGFRKEDVETALRKTNMQLDDALEMLNAISRGGMPGRGMQPPNDPMFGPRAGDGDFGMRYPGPMPYPPGDMPGAGNRPNMNPSLGGMNGGPMGHGPPRPQPNGPPTNAQLRVLVQQIQMAVTAGHLNPQILNQPLAPQTLFLLNQLLNQIKQLQGYQQQQQLAGQRPGANQQALLGLSAKIAQHKNHIQNLQNQITAQQAQYLKNQHPQQMAGGGPQDTDIGLQGLSISESGPSSGGSKLLQLMPKDNDNKDWRTPGAQKSASSPNFLGGLDNGLWSNGGTGSGWPDSNDSKPVNTSNSTDDDNLGIPEFVPGKVWKGAAQMKDPTEDPTMTPGSVASSGILAPLTASDKTSTSSDNAGAGLSSSTWSLATPNTKESSGKDSWSTGLPSSSSSNTLTEMGQGLWGPSRPHTGAKQQTPTTSLSTWPSSNGLSSSSGGWSNGSTTTTSSYLGSIGQSAGSGSSWLLLKNLTAQIDGSTLRTLCLQHGPLNNFHLYLTHGIALVKYSNGLEAKKAQNALNNCVLGNTTILAATAEEHEVETIIRQLSQHQATAQGGGYNSSSKTSGAGDTWSTGSGGLSGWPSSSSVWGAPDNDQRTTPLNSFIPTDLLNEGM